jgi:glycosyltransferase involved in cell wall biosynthesis
VKIAVVTALPPMKLPEAEHGLRLCEALAEANNEVHVLTGANSVQVSGPGLHVTPVMRNWSWREWPRVRNFMKSVAPDAVLLFYIGAMYRFHPMITFAPTLVKRLLPQTTIVTQFSAPFGAANWRARRVSRLFRKLAEKWAGANVDYTFGTLLRDSDRIIVFSDSHRITLAMHDHSVSHKSVLVPPPPYLRMSSETSGACRRRICRQFRIDDDAFLIAYFGYMYPGKGLETLLESFRLALKRRPQLHLLLVGGTPESSRPEVRAYPELLQRQATDLGIQERLTWTGDYPAESDLGSVYLQAADLCVLPFDRGVYLNNSSFSAAAAHGLPILSTRADFVEPAFVHEQNVLLCPPKDPLAMSAAIEGLVDDEGLRRRLREGARRMTREWFAWERVIERTLGALRADIGDEMTAPTAVKCEVLV